jgi:prepilin-type N-terminal cleavage/methylation domain-containing protein
MTDQRGFSLAELLVVIAVLGLIMAGIVGLQQAGMLAYVLGSDRVEAQQNVRVAVTRITREVRQACYITANLGSPATSITFMMPDPSGTGDCTGARIAVRYAFQGSNSTLYRDEAATVGALPAIGSGAPLIDGVSSLVFTGYNSAGSSATTVAPDTVACGTTFVCSVGVSIPMTVGAQASEVVRVRLRNL